MKLYDTVKMILVKYPYTRNSDKRLIWFVWSYKQAIQHYVKEPRISRILFMDYMNMPSSESITRARRKVQENHPELRSTKPVQDLKDAKELTKGTFVFREEL